MHIPTPTLVRRALGAALVAAALSSTARPTAAQKPSAAAAGDKDMQTLANYRLTEAGIRKYYKAMQNMGMAAMKDTTLKDKLEDSNTDEDDLAAMAARYDRVPALKGAIGAAGLTSLEFATITMSYMQAALAYSLMQQAPENLRIKELPKGTPKDNVDFVRTHQALLEQLTNELKAMEPPGGDA